MPYTNVIKLCTYPQITEFRGNYAFLSNFYHAPVTYLNHKYANNEAAFQAQKTMIVNEQKNFYITRLLNPADAKKLGRKVTLRPDWNQRKVQIMYEVCCAKFIQHPNLMQALLATDDALLIEGNTWGDRFWGCVNGFGENQLGQILMDIREKALLERSFFHNTVPY